MVPEFSEDSSDAQLVNLAQRGDKRAFAELYSKYSERISRHLIHIVRDQEEMQDLVQKTFVKVIEKLPTLKEASHFKGWLYQIATRTAYDHLRAEKRRPWHSADHIGPGERRNSVDKEDWNAEFEEQVCTALLFEQILEQMPTTQKWCFRWYMQGWDTQTIAEIFGIKEPSVKAYISGARQKLRKAYWHSEGRAEKKPDPTRSGYLNER